MNNENRDALAEKYSSQFGENGWGKEKLRSCEGYKAGWDARDEEIAEKEAAARELVKHANDKLFAKDETIEELQTQLTAAREEARALREALEDSKKVIEYIYPMCIPYPIDIPTAGIVLEKINQALAHAEREEQK